MDSPLPALYGTIVRQEGSPGTLIIPEFLENLPGKRGGSHWSGG
jgi:hypothetical protein